LARQELSDASDLDYVIAVHRLPESDIRQTHNLVTCVENARKKLKLEEPGGRRMFGGIISVGDICERIGLEQDTNTNHSRRILLLQESVSLLHPDLHVRLLEAVIKRYLIDYPQPKRGVPRFLLNDVMRYWRTLAVDYQAKRWESHKPDWGLRYIKLLGTRKLAYAGMLASLFLVDEATSEYFLNQCQMPTLARLAQLEPELEAERKDDLREALRIAEEFAAHLADGAFREEAEAVESPSDIQSGSRFAQLRDRARELQRCLERVFFQSERLRSRSIQYLSF
jgi:hypothetical protein